MIKPSWHLPLYVAISSLTSSLITNTAFAAVTVLPGETYINQSRDNFDFIDNQGTFENMVFLVNREFSSFDNSGLARNNIGMIFQYGSQLTNTGDFENLGAMQFDFGTDLNNFANFNNFDQIYLNGGSNFTNTGVINNQGFIYDVGNAEQGQISNSNIINNTGSITAIIDSSGVINNNGNIISYELNNQLSGVFNNVAPGMLPGGAIQMYGDLNNAGTFNHNGSIDMGFGNTLNNSGEFNNNGSFFSTESMTINNSGIFNNDSLIDSNSVIGMPQGGYSIINSGTFVNNAGVMGIERLQTSGVFENNSIVSVFGSLMNTQAGVFNNAINSNIQMIGTLDNRGEFNNQSFVSFGQYDPVTGMLIAPELNNSGVFNNSGEIINSGDEGLQLFNSGEFNNNGTIRGFGRTVINNSGLFNSNTNLELSGYSRDGSVLNSGTFENNASLSGVEYLQTSGTFQNNADLSSVEYLQNSGNFENNASVSVYGELVNTATGIFNNITGLFVEVAGDLDNRGEFNNQRDIYINQRFNPDTGLYEAPQLSNSGVFNNDGNIYTSASEGAVLNNSGEFNNNGVINLDIWNSQVDSVINSGVFNNNLDLLGVGYLQNSGAFENNGLVSIDGELVNTATGVFNNNLGELRLAESYNILTGMFESARLNNSGVFNNSGNINVEGFLALNNSGIFNNNALLDLGGSLSSFFSIESSLVNSGVFNNNSDLTGVDSLQNSGTFENNASVSVMDELLNTATGVFNNNFYGFFVDVLGVLDNRGEFNNQIDLYINEGFNRETGWPVAARLSNSGVFNNDGAIYSSGSDGFELNNSGEFNNNGTFTVDRMLDLNNSGIFNNNNRLVLNGWGPQDDSVDNSGVFNNNSDLLGLEYLQNSGTFENRGLVSVTGELLNTTTGVFNNTFSGRLDVQGVLDNQGVFNNQAVLNVSSGFNALTGNPVAPELNNSGLFNNDGFIQADIGEIITLNNAGEFNHNGSFDTPSGLVINNTGTFNNGSQLLNLNTLNISNNSMINNYGMFNNYSVIDGGLSGQILNMGEMNNVSDIHSFQQFSNAGTLNNQGYIAIENTTEMVNESSGVINNSAYSNAQIWNNGTLDNRGAINNNEGSRIDLMASSNTINSGLIVNNGEINGPGDIDNSGTIQNNNNITGIRDITSSGLIVNNGLIQSENMQVSGLLKGNGSVDIFNGLVITEAGTLAPGNSTGYMDITGGLTLDGTFEVEFDWLNTTGYLHDSINVSGDVVFGVNSVLDISLLSEDSFSLGQSFDLLFADNISGDFGSFYYDALFDDGLALNWLILDGTGQDILRLEVVSAVPLPAAFWLFLSGLAGLIAIRRKKA